MKDYHLHYVSDVDANNATITGYRSIDTDGNVMIRITHGTDSMTFTGASMLAEANAVLTMLSRAILANIVP